MIIFLSILLLLAALSVYANFLRLGRDDSGNPPIIGPR